MGLKISKKIITLIYATKVSEWRIKIQNSIKTTKTNYFFVDDKCNKKVK